MTLQFYWYQHPLQSSEQKSHLDNVLLIRLLLFYDPHSDSIEADLSLLGYNRTQMLGDWELILKNFIKNGFIQSDRQTLMHLIASC